MNDILNRVRSGIKARNEVIKELYENTYLRAKIKKYVISNGGDANDADSMHADAVIAFIKRCYHDSFQLKSNVDAYILTIAKNNWIRAKVIENKEQRLTILDDRAEEESSFFGKEYFDTLKLVLGDLDQKCRKVMLMWAQNYRMREIAIRMNYKSEGMARKKKYECMARLKDLFEKHNV